MKTKKLQIAVRLLFAAITLLITNSYVFAQNGPGKGQGLLWKKLQGTNDIKKHPKEGNVAIGLDTAEAKLDVAGGVNIRGKLTADSAKINGPFVISATDSGSFLFDPNVGTPQRDRLRVSTGIFSLMQGFNTIQCTIFPPQCIKKEVSTSFVSMGLGTETPNSKHHLFQKGASNVYTLFTNGTNSNNTNGFQIGINSLGSAELDRKSTL